MLSAEEFCVRSADVGVAGADMAAEFMDSSAPPSPNSILATLASRLGTVSTGKSWPPEDLEFLGKALQALVGVSGSQLRGIAALCRAVPPIGLHPLATLLRGLAEASGKVWWFMQPWIEDSNDWLTLSPSEWDRRSGIVLCRTQIAHLDALAERRRRFEAEKGIDNSDYQAVDGEISSYKSRLAALNGGRADLVLSGGRKKWCVGGESMPASTDLVMAATEYAYDKSFRGSGLNLYPLYSGFAHGSLELVFAHARPGINQHLSTLLGADSVEVHKLVGIACRTFAASFEIALQAFGWDREGLSQWEQEVNALIVEA